MAVMLLVSSSTSGLSQHKSTVRPFSFHYFVELGTLHISNVLLSFVAKCWIINQQGGSDSCRLERNFVVFTLKRLTFPLFFCHPSLFSKIKFFFFIDLDLKGHQDTEEDNTNGPIAAFDLKNKFVYRTLLLPEIALSSSMVSQVGGLCDRGD